MYTCTIHMYTHTHVCMYNGIYMCNMHVYTCMMGYTCIHVQVYNISMYTCTTYTCTHVQWNKKEYVWVRSKEVDEPRAYHRVK